MDQHEIFDKLFYDVLYGSKDVSQLKLNDGRIFDSVMLLDADTIKDRHVFKALDNRTGEDLSFALDEVKKLEIR